MLASLPLSAVSAVSLRALLFAVVISSSSSFSFLHWLLLPRNVTYFPSGKSLVYRGETGVQFWYYLISSHFIPVPAFVFFCITYLFIFLKCS